jgi:SAM-dependent methyltransferase
VVSLRRDGLEEESFLRRSAEGYWRGRLPRAHPREIEKLVRDWQQKPATGRSLAALAGAVLGDLTGRRTLDIGCGCGAISVALARAGTRATGLEVDADAARVARELAALSGQHVRVVLYDGRRMPFRDATFEYCISTSVLEHCEDPVAFLRELGRVVVPGGVAYLSFPNRWYPYDSHTGLWLIPWLPPALRRAVCHLAGRSMPEDYGLHFYSYASFRRLCRAAGVRLEPRLEVRRSATWRRRLKQLLRALNLHHTALTRTLTLILENRPDHGPSGCCGRTCSCPIGAGGAR